MIGKIKKEDIFPLIINIESDFDQKYQEFLSEWKDEKDIPYYLLVGDFIRYLSERFSLGKTENFHKIFGLIEKFQTHGDPYTKEIAIIGFLEDLQNNNLHTGSTPESFIPYLGEESRKSWNELNIFWENVGNHSLKK